MNGKISLSPVDLKVLNLVCKEGLASEQEMAAKLRLNPSTVNYKLKRLEKEKIISSQRYRVNYHKLGLKRMAWIFLRLQSEDLAMENFLEKLLEYPGVHAACDITGSEDIALKVFGTSLNEITEMVMDIEKRFKDQIRSTSINYVTHDLKRHQVILDGKHQEETKLSRLDLKLLKYFTENPRASIKDAASELKVHRNTASSRWNRLLKEKVILKKGVKINPDYYSDIGISFRALVSFDIRSGNAKEVGLKLAQHPEVHELSMISSHYDLIGVIRTPSLHDFYLFHRRLFKSPELRHLINQSYSSIILRGKTKAPELRFPPELFNQ